LRGNYCQQYRDLHDHHWWWRAREKYVLAWVRSLARVRRLTRILDIGCGDGLLFDQLTHFGDVRGIEPDARLVPAGSPWRSRIEPVPFGPGYRSSQRFDLVLMLDVLEHIEADQESLRAVYDLLEPGGYYLLTVPALPALWSQHDLVNCHYRRYTLKSLHERIERAGFEHVEAHYFFGWTILPMYLRRLLYPANGSDPLAHEESQVKVPQRLINQCLYWTCLLEQRLAGRRGVPVGSSIFAVMRRPAASVPAPVGSLAMPPALVRS
jgi:SAM-dependent methyltransferase